MNAERLSKELLDQEQQEAVTALYEGNTLLVAPMGKARRW